MAAPTLPNSKRCIALAYSWCLAPVDFKDYDIALVVGHYDSKSNRSPQVTSYHARLPDKQSTGRQSDVSGNLGIIFPITDDGETFRATASERLLADGLMWELSKLSFSDEETIVLLQGPLLPKLRGRLLYRSLSDKITIFTLTDDPKWFGRLEASEHIARNLDAQSNISSIYPPKGIDRASRCWVYRLDEKLFFHFEVITSMGNITISENWEKSRKRDIQALLKTVPTSGTRLPEALRLACNAVKEQCEMERGFVWFLPQLRGGDYNIENFEDSNPVRRVLQAIDQGLVPMDDLFASEMRAASEKIDFRDESKVYTAFRSKWPSFGDFLKGETV